MDSCDGRCEGDDQRDPEHLQPGEAVAAVAAAAAAAVVVAAAPFWAS